MKCVVCVRNPVDVVRSLEVRDGDEEDAAIDLWLQHTSAALRHTAGRPRLIVGYENLVDRLEDEVGRLASFSGLEPESMKDVRQSVAGLVESELWHYRSSLADVLSDPAVPAEAKVLYLWLQGDIGRPPPADAALAQRGLGDDLAAGLARTRTELAARKNDVADLRGERARWDAALADACSRLEEAEILLTRRTTQLRDMQNSSSWRLTAPLREAKRRLLARRERASRV